jgi:hypothetical protein
MTYPLEITFSYKCILSILSVRGTLLWVHCSCEIILSEFCLLRSVLILMQMTVVALGEWRLIDIIVAFVVTIIVTSSDDAETR